VGFVAPLGYSLNLTGTSIYLTLATVFIAQATGTAITPGTWVQIFALLLVTSKTAAAVTGGGFVALAATLSVVGDVPVAGLTLLLGIDRIMSEARALTNLVGNAVAAVAVSRWDGELDVARARAVLSDVAAVEAEGYEAGRIDPRAAVPDLAGR
jgi:aerobic C4-dicarboxylate transport protein